MKKILLLFLLLSLCLLGACATINDERSLGTQLSDTSIETKIKTALLFESPIKSIRDVNIYSFNGDVYLVGQLPKELRTFAVNKAQSVDGVNKVTAHWFPTDSSSTINDTRLEANIDSELLLHKDIKSTQVRVDVWGGHVVLLGLMSSQREIDRVVNLVKTMTYVKSVTNYLNVATNTQY
ncbi:BON domain-containing protein [Desulfovibrio litoralis]|uniref:Hyperosmotically inducible protein n=1 Tax=Desulfovibrio litoralis DSM 11393 TaxID=1121455 RepID=A0A1M7RUF8_9BACT|nr:BON domain-containing protein [Desulfovibrio litoralis]SHN49905.1 hyperosmotically inducible protein [Desulfovibrio litoralis DSM 11393]